MPTYRVCGFKSRLRHQETKAQLSWAFHADVAQLVEHDLAKVGVAGSNPVVRSTNSRNLQKSCRLLSSSAP